VRRRMIMRILVCAAVAALLLSVPTADSMAFMPESGTSPWLGSEFRPIVGHWSEYLMTPEGQEPINVRVAIVGKEGDAYWIENVMVLEGRGKMITKQLVTGDPDNEENIKRMIMKSGDEPAMEMPVEMMKMMGPDGGLPQTMMQGEEEPEVEEPESKPVDLGVESVTVPAGTFKAHHWQFVTEEEAVDAWASEKVTPYGLVKMTAKDFEMVLIGHGDDAKSLITETPQKMPMPNMKMPGMPGAPGQ
jgi:hypothetical protein